MTIKDAKEQIKNAMTAYFSKNEYGYEIPIEKQRPVFMMGPPGIGKTAIMEQIASEMHVGLISYSMTHHTRQSALGLPFIVHKNYNGYECDVSEYTMSEIISSMYDLMAHTDVKEGILFLDEINCVSETLSPLMLQFLQYKVFGRHKVPDGWIVVTAGNPPEYNSSVHDFDIVTWDRLKRIDIEPDYEAWKEYAYARNVHPAVLTYLEIRKSDFYSIESTVDGKTFVTARGWDDLSRMIQVYEKLGIAVDEKLVGQYLQNRKTAKNFAVYYDLFNKYRSDYQVNDILEGKASEEVTGRARKAKFDERLALIGLLLDAVSEEVTSVLHTEAVSYDLMDGLKHFKSQLDGYTGKPATLIEHEIQSRRARVRNASKSMSLSRDEQHVLTDSANILAKIKAKLGDMKGAKGAFDTVKKMFDANVSELRKMAEHAGQSLENVFKFVEDVFGEGQEILVLVTELTVNPATSRFIARYGSKAYFEHNKELLFYERQKEIISELEALDLK